MKYKYLAIFVCLFLVSHSATAQRKARLNTIEGERHKPPKGSRGTLVNFEHQGNYYYLTAAGPLYVIVTPIGGGVGNYPSGFNLVQLDNKAAIKNTLKVEVPSTPERVYYENYAVLGDFIYVFYSIRNRETKKNNLFTTKIDMSTKKQSFYKVGEVPSKKDKSDGREVLSIFTSKNQKYMAMVYTKGNIFGDITNDALFKARAKSKKKIKTNKTLKKLSYTIFDENMETVDYAKKLELENIGKNELIHRIQLLNTGSLVVITEQKVDYSATIDKVTDAGNVNKKNLEKVKKSSTKLGYKYTTHLIKGDVDKALPLENLDGGMMAYRSVKIKERANQLELFSFYTQNGTYANGISHWSITPDGVIARYEQVDFPSKTELELNKSDEDGQVKAKAKSKRAERKAKALKKAYTNLIYNMYKVIDVLELPDGNFEIIGEKYELRVVTTTTRNSQGVTSTQTTYYHDYGPAALIKVDSASNLGAVRIVEYTETFVNFNPGLAGRFIVQPEGSILAITPSYYGIINSKSNVNDVTPTTEIRKTLRNQKRRVNKVCETPKGSFLIGQRWGKMYPVIIELK